MTTENTQPNLCYIVTGTHDRDDGDDSITRFHMGFTDRNTAWDVLKMGERLLPDLDWTMHYPLLGTMEYAEEEMLEMQKALYGEDNDDEGDEE